MAKAPLFSGAFSISTSIVRDGGKLFCNADVIDEVWVRGFFGLTSVFVGKVESLVCKYFALFDLADSRGEEKVYPLG